MSRRVVVPGPRDVRGTLDEPTEGDGSTDGDDGGSTPVEADRLVVACPPHPQHGGSRSDPRLRAVADALVERGVACLRFDYGPWDGGHGETDDARRALAWDDNRYGTVGLFGYSFGATVALLVAAESDPQPRAVSALAPTARLANDPTMDAVAALDDIDCPVQVVVGERDETVDWEPVVERARERGLAVETVPADHHFVGQYERVAEHMASFLVAQLARP